MHYSELGYDEYDAYLHGPEWKALKQFFYEHRRRYECDICGTRERILLHKRSYKFLSLPELKKRYRGDTTKILRYLHTYMVYLCQGCNRKVHFYGDGTKVALEYRALRERENKIRQRTHKAPPKHFPVKKLSFLGSYFKELIRK